VICYLSIRSCVSNEHLPATLCYGAARVPGRNRSRAAPAGVSIPNPYLLSPERDRVLIDIALSNCLHMRCC
jgi:hypothetical protein